MPRLVLRRKRPLSAKERRRRANRRQVLGYKTWVDPFPEIRGTRPEKMILKWLEVRDIPYRFQEYERFNIPLLNLDKWYRPDFIIPSLKLIIEVQGVYWHTKPAQIEKDAFKFAIYKYLGWKIAAIWDTDILRNIDLAILKAAPQLSRYTGVRGGRVVTKNASNIDDSKGIRTANQNRTNYSLRRISYNTTRKKTKYQTVRTLY